MIQYIKDFILHKISNVHIMKTIHQIVEHFWHDSSNLLSFEIKQDDNHTLHYHFKKEKIKYNKIKTNIIICRYKIGLDYQTREGFIYIIGQIF